MRITVQQEQALQEVWARADRILTKTDEEARCISGPDEHEAFLVLCDLVRDVFEFRQEEAAQ